MQPSATKQCPSFPTLAYPTPAPAQATHRPRVVPQLLPQALPELQSHLHYQSQLVGESGTPSAHQGLQRVPLLSDPAL